jgi:hypothetical protein
MGDITNEHKILIENLNGKHPTVYLGVGGDNINNYLIYDINWMRGYFLDPFQDRYSFTYTLNTF